MRLIGLLGLAALAAGAGPLLAPFWVTLLAYVGLYTLVTLGVVLLTGVVGVTSFGQAAFVGVAGYATALVSLRYGQSPWLGLVASVLLTLAAAAMIGGVTLRLSGHYLPLATISWGLSIYYVFGNLEMLGGHTGITDIPPVSVGALVLETPLQYFYLIWACVLLSMLVTANLLDSRVGRAMRAVKNSRVAAESFGVDTARVRFGVFLYAAVLASVSGWLYAHMLRFLNPSPFSLTMGIEYLFMAVIGGAGQVWGALLGAGLVTALNEYLRGALPLLLGQAGSFEVIVFGVLVIALLQLNGDAGVSAAIAGRFGRPRRGALSSDAPALSSRRKGTSGATLLEVQDVSKAFGGLQALEHVGFAVHAGEIVAIIGPNGAGKTTLFNVVTGLLRPDAGVVRVRGRPVQAKPRRMVHLGVTRTFQHVHLVPELSVLENAMLGAHIRSRTGPLAAALRLDRGEERRVRAEAVRQLRRVGLAEVAHERATGLPLGQQRLLEIVRALCADPEVVLLDEPAAGLRHREKLELAALLRELRDGGLGIVLVEHDMEFVMRLSDRVVVINFGQKLAEGRPDVVRRDPLVLEAYLGLAG